MTQRSYAEPLLRGVIMPELIEVELRKHLVEVQKACSPVNCMIAQARAESLVRALELLKALESAPVERMYILIENAATARLLELEQ